MNTQRSCFIIMPFRPEFHYFFLYVKQHIEEKHSINCLRGDNDVLTIPLLDKIKKYIENSDVLIADCTGRNPNVFYELGIAHTLNKKVILISMDDVKEAPADIRHLEFIKYELVNHEEFLGKLDNALMNVFVEHYEHLYHKAIAILDDFKKATQTYINPIKKDMFITKIAAIERQRQIPESSDTMKFYQYLMPLIVDINSDFDMMEKITRWLTKN